MGQQSAIRRSSDAPAATPFEKPRGDYRTDGFALIERILSPAVCQRLLAQLKRDFERTGRRLEDLGLETPVLARPAIELSGHGYSPLLMLLWGLTPTIEAATGARLDPTYCYFRIYRRGDTCRIHADRLACEHSLSLTLACSDDLPWALEVGTGPSAPLSSPVTEGFEGEPSVALPMIAGDAVLYRGVTHRHGRSNPNPNAWSAHLFCHWVDRDGPYANEAFDRRPPVGPGLSFDFT